MQQQHSNNGILFSAKIKWVLSSCKRHRKHAFDLWVRKIPCKRKWQPTSVFLPGESHGQRSLAGYSPWGHKQSDRTEMTEHTQKQMSYQIMKRNREILNTCYQVKKSVWKAFIIYDCNSMAFGKRQGDGDNKEIRGLVRREGKSSGGGREIQISRG